MDQEISDAKLGFGYWFVTHKLMLKNIITALLIVIDLLLIAFILFSIIDAYGLRFDQHRNILTALYSGGQVQNLQIIRQSQLPRDIVIEDIKLYPSGDNTDIVATLSNPNLKWGARFDYSFILATGKTRTRQGFIFPGESKPIIDLNVEGGSSVSDVELSNIVWVKANQFAATFIERFDFTIDDIQFLGARQSELSKQVPISRVTFTVRNNSPYNYRGVQFIINLLSGTQVVAINTAATESLKSGETKTVEATWFTNLPSVQNVQVLPQIDILNPDVYLEFEGENGVF